MELKGNFILRNGIWFAKNNSGVSYPEDGNDKCLQIEEQSFWFRHRNNCIKELVSRFSANKVFWDIGGGNGYVSMGLQENGIETVLVEPGKAGVTNAKQRGIKNVICGTFHDVTSSLGKNQIEAAGAFDVIEHIKDDSAFIEEVNSTLVPNGKFYLTVPAYNFLWSDEDVEAGHFRRYTLSSISKVLEKAEFSIIYETYLFSFLPVPVFFLRTVPSLFNVKRNSNSVEKYKKEHKENLILRRFIQWEQNQILDQKEIPFGSSCLIVAQKI